MREVVPFKRPRGGAGEGGGAGSGDNGDRWLYSVAAQILALLPLENEEQALKALSIAVSLVKHLPDITQT